MCLIFCFLLSPQTKAEIQKPQDSVGIRTVNGKVFILHEVTKGQGLFSISKRYGVSVDEINSNNPEVANGIKVGQIILIPSKVNHENAAKEKTVNKPAETKQSDNESKSNEEQIHIVKTGETLYKVASLYKTSINNIRKWNTLKSDNLNIGQKLIVKKGSKVSDNKPELVKTEKEPAEKTPETTKKEANPAEKENKPHVETYGENDTQAKQEVKQEPEKQVETQTQVNNETGEVKETGICLVAEVGSIDQGRSFALHNNAPIGTIIMVTNLQNNKSVFVRVVGTLAPGDKSLLKLSKAAAARIGLDESQSANVRLNYAK
jgi:LysM repeat protein